MPPHLIETSAVPTTLLLASIPVYCLLGLLVSAALQRSHYLESLALPLLSQYWLKQDLPWLCLVIMCVWTYVISSMWSAVAQAIGNPRE
ncbi:hypothetical protein BC938DRAFT_479694 [Jimgerdemannia flammicorona]|uniref:Uncharacterized protein n=1 Tax=Jimgerdemannia flammicorona TaxID=994334 RepID=A0A433QKC1_9FUNG|nr:hypothetical protein BC938DRAFT_479694 [Jimgerdemannia flammicorona]